HGEGEGRTESMSPPPFSFFFSKSLFLPDTFHFERRIDLANDVVVSPALIDFRGRIDFTPTTEKGFFLATVNQIEFEYAPFDLPPDLYPEPLFTGIERESLDVITNPEISGFLDMKSGRLFVEVPMNWLNTQGELVATSLDYFQVDIRKVAGFPDLMELAWDSSGSFNPAPGPCPFALSAASGFRWEARQ
ncbi:MAG: hypothetical protein KGM95_08830, partial [Betaproteobacteria bacterium]|nr:hypothetical protein [Betaproteobacteria bacterium]